MSTDWSDSNVHVPVLLDEVVEALLGDADPATLEGWLVDGTVGAGGHASALLAAFPRVRLIGSDQDPEVLAIAERRLARFGERVRLVRGRISALADALDEQGIDLCIGCLFDLGANSLHFDRAERGFSFQADGPLDMRMDPLRKRTAADIVNSWDETDLADLFYYEGGEHNSRAIARAVVKARRRVPFLRTGALADLIAEVSGSRRGGKIHPATRCFQALRRAVNEEGEELIHGLSFAEERLADGGRLAIISFHSGEDAIVKRFAKERARDGVWQLATKKPVRPSPAERRSNPRARSARLRCVIRSREEIPSRAATKGGGRPREGPDRMR